MGYLSDMRRSIGFILVLCFTVLMMAGFWASSAKAAKPFIPPAFNTNDFTDPRVIDNPFLTFIPKSAFCYEADTEDGIEYDEVTVTDCDKLMIRGLHTIVVRDTVRLDDGEDTVVTEDTYDIYAQDNSGNVWYLGEASEECESGDMEGSWNADQEGAEPGIVMLKEDDLMPGNSYPQEFLEDVAEDMGKVQRLNANVTEYCDKDCLKTKEWTRLEPGAIGVKYFARNIIPGIGEFPGIGGMVLDEDLLGGKTVMSVLVQVVPPEDAEPGYCPTSYMNAQNNLCANNPPPMNCDDIE